MTVIRCARPSCGRCLAGIALFFPLVFGSCSSRRFYNAIDGGGKIHNRPSVQWQSPNSFVYRRDPARPFQFVRGNGEVIEPPSIYTDGGSIPKLVWGYPGYSPWDYTPAYIVHDWLYDAHRLHLAGAMTREGRKKHYSREEADLVLAEAIKAQMKDPLCHTNESPWHVYNIYWAVRAGGTAEWNAKARPLPSDRDSGPELNPLELLPLPSPGTVFGVVGSLISPQSSTPDPPPPDREPADAARR